MTVFHEFLIIIFCALLASALAGLGARRLAFLQKISARHIDRAVAALVCGYILLFSALTLLRYLSFNIGYLDDYTSWDLGQYDQLVWNSLHGRLFETSFFPDAPNFLGKTFTPILLAFVPLYAFWANPMILLIVQTLALAVGALPLYWFGRARLGAWWGLTMVLGYLLSPALQNTNVAEFHEVALLTPALMYTTFFLLRRHYAGFLVSLGLALLIKEETALIAIMYGVYLFGVQRQRVFGAALVLFGIGWTILLLQYLIPYFRTGEWGGTFYYFGEGKLTGARYAYLGKSVGEILNTALTRPDIVLSELLRPTKIAYVLHLLVPLACLPLLGWEIAALALPTFGYTLLSQYAHQHSLAAAYHAPILPFLFFGAILGTERVLRWRAQQREAYACALTVLVLVTSASSYWQEAPGPLARKFQPNRYVLNEHTAIGHRLLALVPPKAIVAAQNELLGHLTHRQFIYEVSLKDYRFFDYLVADNTRGWYRVHESFWEPYLASGYFDIVAEEDGWVIAKRRAPDQSLQIRFDDQMTLLAFEMIPADSLRGGQTLRPIATWRAERALDARYIVQIDLVDRDGRTWQKSEHEPWEGAFPTNQWQATYLVPEQYRLHINHPTPAGEYRLIARVYDAATRRALSGYAPNGERLGTAITLERLWIQKSQASVTASQIEIENRLAIDFEEMRLLGCTSISPTITRDETLALGLYWRARQKPRGDYTVVIQLRDTAGNLAFARAARPAKDTYPTPRWESGEVLLDWHDLALPPTLAPGTYHIWIALRDENTQRVLGETLLTTTTFLR